MSAMTERDAQALDDDALVEAVNHNVWNAGFFRKTSVFDDNCTILWREAVRRGNEGLYKKGYSKAARAAGIEA